MSDTADSTHERTSVLIVTRNLPPLRGGMERLNLHIAIELSVRFLVHVVGPDGCRDALPATIKVHQTKVRPLWRFMLHASLECFRLAWKIKPRVVMAGSGLMAPMAVLAAQLAGGRSVVYAHGLDLVVRHRLYRAIWLPFLRRCDACIVNSRHTARLAAQAGIKPDRITIIHPGVTLPDNNSKNGDADFRQRYGLADSKLLLSVGRLTRRKGLLEFVRNALPLIVATHPNAVLVVIGDEALDALNSASSGGANELLACADELVLRRHILMLGACSEKELNAAYDAADLCVFPLCEIPGDVEGFGMVAIEAAAHGLPTVAFDVGGVADAVAVGHSGWLVAAGDYVALVKRITQTLDAGRTPAFRADARRFAATFEWQHFGSRLSSELQRLIRDENPQA